LKDGGIDQRASTVAVGPLSIWLLVQLAAIALAALRVPLAAEYPQPAEFFAVNLLLATQFAWVAILFPWLLRSWSMTIIAAASAWIMLLMAAAMAAWSMRDVIAPAAYVTLFIVLLTLLRFGLSRHGQLFASAIVSTYVIGGPLVWYLQLDLGASQRHDDVVMFGPLLPALLDPRHLLLSGWIVLFAIGGFALIGCMIQMGVKKRDPS
jgi:hypothetical protein